MNKLSLILVGGGAIALALSLVMGWLGFPHVLRSQIKKSSRLEKGSQTYEFWKGPAPIPVYLKFHFFNVTNPEEIQEGGKPRVTEMGPYTYLEKRMKVDIGPGIKNDTLQYRNQLWLYFVPEMSTGSEQDMLTFINIPFVGVAKMATGLTDIDFIHTSLDDKLTEKGETLFKRTSIRDFLFDGFSIEAYLELLKDPAVALIGEVKIPEPFLNGKFALYEGKNGSDDGVYEVNTGVKSYKDYGQIQSWNNYTVLPWWKHDSCNNISGTDGTIFSPFLTRETVLLAYSPEICRSLIAVYDQDVDFKGIPGYRFTTDPKMFMGPHHNPANWCYCVEKDPRACEMDGLLLMSGCADGAPIALSSAHFYGAQQSLIDAVDGISPVEEKHKTFLDIEPNTAATMRAAKRLQMNIELVQHEFMPTFEKVRNITFPIMWAEESAELTDDLLKLFAQLHTVLGWVDMGKWIMVGVSMGCVGLGVLVDSSLKY